MAYINGIGIISPQNTLPGSGFLEPVVEQTADFLKCIEPVYKTYIDPLAARRLSRLIKMGISSARICIRDAGIEMPDAIITGTGLGSIEDTEKILGEMRQEERFLNPTPFIQSTYNTISSQIAINLKCHHYNSTYVHRAFSFESCLVDAMLQLEEGSSENVLAGGIDEMTINHLSIIRRLGDWKRGPMSNLDLWRSDTPGALAGEGAAYFILSLKKTGSTYATVETAETLYKPASSEQTAGFIKEFLYQHGLSPEDIDLVMMGNNGNMEHDQVCEDIISLALPRASKVLYKHLCGEYHTVSGFALYTASNILRGQSIPGALQLESPAPDRINNILIHNHFRNVDHAFILVRR
jgi:3-oxoacyl-(acyl-carrier-protein) synthase